MSKLGKRIIKGLKEFNDAIKSGEPLERRFKVTDVSRCRTCKGRGAYDDIRVGGRLGMRKCQRCKGTGLIRKVHDPVRKKARKDK